MKNKIEYSTGIIITALISYYSYCHPERYHILIPIIFGALCVLGIAFLATDDKK